MELWMYKVERSLSFYVVLNNKQLSAAWSLPAEVCRALPSGDTYLCPDPWAASAHLHFDDRHPKSFELCFQVPLTLAALSDPQASPEVWAKKCLKMEEKGQNSSLRFSKLLSCAFWDLFSLWASLLPTAKDGHTASKGRASMWPALTLGSEFSYLESELTCARWKPKCNQLVNSADDEWVRHSLMRWRQSPLVSAWELPHMCTRGDQCPASSPEPQKGEFNHVEGCFLLASVPAAVCVISVLGMCPACSWMKWMMALKPWGCGRMKSAAAILNKRRY